MALASRNWRATPVPYRKAASRARMTVVLTRV
jgi:hypothetical protein